MRRGAASGRQRGLALVVTALLLLIIGLVTASLLPGLVETLRSGPHRDDAALLRSARDDILGYAMRQCALPPALPHPPPGEEGTPVACTGYLSYEVAHFSARNGLALCYVPVPELQPAGALGTSARYPGWTLARPDGTTASDLAFVILSRGQNRLRDAGIDHAGRTVTSAPYGALVAAGQNPEMGPRPYDDQIEYVTLDALWTMTARCRGAAAESTASTVRGPGQPAPAAIYGATGGYAGLKVNGVRLTESNRYAANGRSADDSIPCQATRWGAAAWKMLFLFGDPLAPAAIAWQASYAGGQRNAWYRFELTCNTAGDATVRWSCKRYVDYSVGEVGGFGDVLSETVAQLEPQAPGTTRYTGNVWLTSRMPRSEGFAGGVVEVAQLELNNVVLPAANGRMEHRSDGHADSVHYLLVQRRAPSKALLLAGDFRFDWSGTPDPLFGLEVRVLFHDIPEADRP